MSRRAWLGIRFAGGLMIGAIALSCAAPGNPAAPAPNADRTVKQAVQPSHQAPVGATDVSDPPTSSARAAAGQGDRPAPSGPSGHPGEEEAAHAYVPGELVQVEVGFDKRVSVVHARPGQRRVLLYLHGVCGNPVAFEPWAKSMVPHATLISLVGDRPCPGGYRHKWSHDVASLDRRVRAAVDAVEAARGEPLEHERLAVAGYSQGALRAESLAKRFPARYPHVVLMAGPLPPSLDSVAQASRVVIMAGEMDRQKHLRDAASQMADAGTTVRFIELPGARHGEYGPQAEQIMSDMLGWLFQPR